MGTPVIIPDKDILPVKCNTFLKITPLQLNHNNNSTKLEYFKRIILNDTSISKVWNSSVDQINVIL